MEEVHEASNGVQSAIGVPRLSTNLPLLVYDAWRLIELVYNQNVCARPVAATMVEEQDSALRKQHAFSRELPQYRRGLDH